MKSGDFSGMAEAILCAGWFCACRRCPGRSGKPLSAVSLFPDAPGSHCTLSVGRRTLRKAVQFATGQGFFPRILSGVIPNAQNHAVYSINAVNLRLKTLS
ncbi:MAG: hypothetical protein LBL07_13790 [Tannerella sp.]|nr:hypothetical protein [Tannerella sp.]